MTCFYIYLIAINVLAAVITCADKLAAIKKLTRVPEKSLITLAALGGAAGVLFSMILCRHKIRKPKFIIGVPLILAAELGAIFYLVKIGVLNI